MHSHGEKHIFKPIIMKICHGHNLKDLYEKNSMLWCFSNKEWGNDTT